jgi:hypothetical protein
MPRNKSNSSISSGKVSLSGKKINNIMEYNCSEIERTFDDCQRQSELIDETKKELLSAN